MLKLLFPTRARSYGAGLGSGDAVFKDNNLHNSAAPSLAASTNQSRSASASDILNTKVHADTAENRLEFIKFDESHQSLAAFLVFGAIYFVCAIALELFTISRITGEEDYEDDEYILRPFLIISSILCPLMVSNLGIMIVLSAMKQFPDDSIMAHVAAKKYIFQSLFLIGNAVWFALLLNVKAHVGNCSEESSVFQYLYCNNSTDSTEDEHALTLGTTLALVLVPMLFFFLSRNIDTGVVFVAWVISMLGIALTMVVVKWETVLGSLLFTGLSTALIYYESDRRSRAMYLLVRKLQFTISENERLAQAREANEMRAMIGNVAHDLKTPLASFLSGVDMVAGMVDDVEQLLCSSREGSALFQDNIAPIRTCLDSIHNTNAFMIMTINRCIDYTKASKGMKLVPRRETIELREALELPLHVMRDMQQRLEIVFDETALQRDICSHIITDKQWLQENLLCLLSNAIKYSSKGKVEITVAKVPEKSVMSKAARKRLAALQEGRDGTAAASHKSTASNTSQRRCDKSNDGNISGRGRGRGSLHRANSALTIGRFLFSRAGWGSGGNGGGGGVTGNNSATSRGNFRGSKRGAVAPVGAGAGPGAGAGADSRGNTNESVDLEHGVVYGSGSDNFDEDSGKMSKPPVSMAMIAKMKSNARMSRGNLLAAEADGAVGGGREGAALQRTPSEQRRLRDYARVANVLSFRSRPKLQPQQGTGELGTSEVRSMDIQVAPSPTRKAFPIFNRTLSGHEVVAPHSTNSTAILNNGANAKSGINPAPLLAQGSKANSMFFKSLKRFSSTLGAMIEEEDLAKLPMVLKFEVQDTGIGLSEEAMKNLFNPFKQAQRLAGGTGLGLYSLAKRMDALGGYYGVKNRPDGKQGSVFWFAVPYKPDTATAEMFQLASTELKTAAVERHTLETASRAANSNGNTSAGVVSGGGGGGGIGSDGYYTRRRSIAQRSSGSSRRSMSSAASTMTPILGAGPGPGPGPGGTAMQPPAVAGKNAEGGHSVTVAGMISAASGDGWGSSTAAGSALRSNDSPTASPGTEKKALAGESKQTSATASPSDKTNHGGARAGVGSSCITVSDEMGVINLSNKSLQSLHSSNHPHQSASRLPLFPSEMHVCPDTKSHLEAIADLSGSMGAGLKVESNDDGTECSASASVSVSGNAVGSRRGSPEAGILGPSGGPAQTSASDQLAAMPPKKGADAWLAATAAAEAAVAAVTSDCPKTPSSAVDGSGRGRGWMHDYCGNYLLSEHHSYHSTPTQQRFASVGNHTKTSPSNAANQEASEHLDLLLVDDSLAILKMTSMMLKRQKHRVTQAENGAEALETILDRYSENRKAFDIVIMDLQMPVMDGLEAVRRLRAEEKVLSMSTADSIREFTQIEESIKQPQLVVGYDDRHGRTVSHSFKLAPLAKHCKHQLVIGCSANSDHETMQEALKAGVDAFMAKPFSVDTFYDIMRQLMHNTQSQHSQ